MDNMSRRSQIRRLLWYLAPAVMGLLIIVFGTLRIQQWVLRHRAERLLADIQQIELRKTSFEDAQKLFGRWSKWGHYEGECTRRHCLFSIVLRDFLDGHPSLFKRASLNFLYSSLGGRPTEVYAGVTVIDGAVWEKWFGFGTSSRGFIQADAEVSTASWLPAMDERFALHPNHALVPLDVAPCVWIRANFTPYEDPAEVRRLMGFNLSDLTHWGFAREKDDVMPAACDEARKEQPLVVAPDARSDLPRHESLEYLARDAGRVAVVKIISKPSQSGDPWDPWKLETRLEEPLKRYSPRDVGTVQELHLRCSDLNWVPDTRVGERVLIFTDWDPESDTITCGGIAPFTEENLAATRRGIAQDYKAVFGEPKR
ncbi:MAG TPA: hypothetical protein VJY15_20365 [Candidatus Acidoferrum sp.]|nr:hypothetical protein [Candidatus Acidoferrum sp.]